MIDINKDKEFSLIKIFGNVNFENWLKKYPILENKDVLSWIRDKIDKFTDEGKDAKKFSITMYLNALQQYCNYNEVNNPSKLLEETKVDMRNSRVKKYLQFLLKYPKEKSEELAKIGFREIKKNKKLTGKAKKPSNATIRNNIQAKIKSFYSNRGFPISYNLKSVKSGANKNELTLTKNIIKKIQSKLESANYRLICKFESQTGLRINDVLEELTNGNYGIENHQKHYFIRNFETQKEKVIINFLFFTKELTELIQSITAIDDLTKLDLKTLFLTRKNTRINKSDYLRRLKEIIKELGIDGNMKTHAFRKYFTDTIDNLEEKDDKFNKHLEGREPDYRDAVYIRSLKNIGKSYKKWLKIEKEICIDCIVYDDTYKDTKRHSKEILDLKEQIIKLKDQNDDMLRERSEFKEKIEKMEKAIIRVNEILPNLIESNNFFENQYKTLLGKISDKEIIETLGLKEIKTDKKLKIGK